MPKQQWEVVDSTSSVMRSLKKILFKGTLQECHDFRKAHHEDEDNIRVRTKIEARAPKEDNEVVVI
jgi:hypothetical protein